MGDEGTTIEQLKAVVHQHCTERDWDKFHGIKDLAIGVTTEAAELLEIFRFRSDEEIKTILARTDVRQAIGDELSDVLFFLLRISDRFDFDLSACFAAKMAKNVLRYPVESSRGSNKKYTELGAPD